MGVSVVTRIAGIEPNNSLFVATADVVIANTTNELTQFGTGVGSLVIPAGWWEVGKSIHLYNRSLISFLAGTTATVRIKLGNSTIVQLDGTYPAPGATDVIAEMDFLLTCRSTGPNGKFIGQGLTLRASGAGLATISSRPLTMMAEVEIDTTVDDLLEVTHQWGAASTSNSLRVTNFVVEAIPSPDMGVC